MKATGPGEYFKYFSFSIDENEDTPSTTWYAEWIENEEDYSFDVTNYDFCDGVLTVMRSAKQAGFDDIAGPYETPPGESIFGIETKYSKVHIEGCRDEFIEYIVLFWDFNCCIGGEGTLGEIESRFTEYRNKLKSCLPSSMVETEEDTEDSIYDVKKIKFEGDFEGDKHYVGLKIREASSADKYELKLVIEEITLFISPEPNDSTAVPMRLMKSTKLSSGSHKMKTVKYVLLVVMVN